MEEAAAMRKWTEAVFLRYKDILKVNYKEMLNEMEKNGLPKDVEELIVLDIKRSLGKHRDLNPLVNSHPHIRIFAKPH